MSNLNEIRCEHCERCSVAVEMKKEIASLRLILSHQPDLIMRYDKLKKENETLRNIIKVSESDTNL